MAKDFDKLEGMIKKLAAAIAARQGAFVLLTAKRLEGLMKRRIFNEGKDTSGGQIGKYKSPGWIKKRSKSGRQTSKVDLQYTGALFNSMKSVKDGKNEAAIAIVNDADYMKAKGNEERRKKAIFEPTKDEIKQIEEYFEDIVDDAIEKIVLNL